MFKFFHIGDSHFSTTNLEKCQIAAVEIEVKATMFKPNLIGLSGDLQDRRQVLDGDSAVNPMIAHIKKLSTIAPVILPYGNENHDPKGSLEVLKEIKTIYPIQIVERDSTFFLVNENREMKFNEVLPTEGQIEAIIHVLPYPTKQHLLGKYEGMSLGEANALAVEELRKIFLGMNAKAQQFKVPKIFIGHCNVSGAKISNGQTISSAAEDIILTAGDLELIGADYGALGHIHLHQEILKNWWYAGSTSAVNWGETERKFINEVQIDGGVIEVRPNELLSRPMATHEVSFNTEMGNFVEKEIETAQVDWKDAHLRLRVYLNEEQRKTFDEEALKTVYAGAYDYKIEVFTLPEERMRSEEIAHVETLEQQFIEWTKAKDLTERVDAAMLAEVNDIEKEFNAETETA